MPSPLTCDVCHRPANTELYPDEVDGKYVHACPTCFGFIDKLLVERALADERAAEDEAEHLEAIDGASYGAEA